MIKINLKKGIFNYWFRDSNTKEPLSDISQIEIIEDNTKVSFEIPIEIKNKKNVNFYLIKIR